MRASISVVLAAAALLAVVLLSPNRSAAQPSDSRDALLAKYRCPLADLLRQVFEAPSAYQERDRFLVVFDPRYPQGYVQCMFAVNRSKLFCEASSGYYAERVTRPRISYLPSEMIAALTRLGFVTGTSEKNYPYERDLEGTPDFNAIATLILSAMHDGYGARAESELDVKAPFARKDVAKCGM